MLNDTVESRIPIHKQEADALEYTFNYSPEKGSRFACAITIEKWMNEMPVRIGYSKFDDMVDGAGPFEDKRAWFYKI